MATLVEELAIFSMEVALTKPTCSGVAAEVPASGAAAAAAETPSAAAAGTPAVLDEAPAEAAAAISNRGIY